MHFGSPKWRASHDGVHLDLYVPHQSRLGANLQLRVEQLVAHAEVHNQKRVLEIGAHTATKWAALLDRPDSMPGRKDRHEILALLALPDAQTTPAVIRAASARTPEQIDTLIRKGFELLGDTAGLDRRQRNALRQASTAWTHPQTAGALARTGQRPPSATRPQDAQLPPSAQHRPRRVARAAAAGSRSPPARAPRRHGGRLDRGHGYAHEQPSL